MEIFITDLLGDVIGVFMGYGFSIEPVPLPSRRYGFLDNFAIWFGAGISIAEFWAGAILVASPLNISLKSALVAIILGHALGNALLSFIGYLGVRTGLPTMVISRAALGLRGSYIVSILNYLQLIGWTAVMLVVGALAMDNISLLYGLGRLYWVWVIVLGALVIGWAYVGPEGWSVVEKSAAVLLLALTGWLGYVLISETGFNPLINSSLKLDQSFWLALDLVIAMPVSWAPLIADYTRFTRNGATAFWGSYIGYFLSSGLFYFLGAFSNSLLHKLDPVSVVAYYGLGIPAMLIIVFSTATTTFLDVYSAAITFKNLRPEADGRLQVVIVGVVGTAVALVFQTLAYEWFLILVGGAFVSLTGLMIADSILRRDAYTADKIVGTGVGVRVGALVIWLAGFVIYMLLAAPGLLPNLYIPFFSELGARAGSSIPTLCIVFILQSIYVRFLRR
jgi:NCS1 family nucleobase:cation symporter-1